MMYVDGLIDGFTLNIWRKVEEKTWWHFEERVKTSLTENEAKEIKKEHGRKRRCEHDQRKLKRSYDNLFINT